MIDDKIIKEEFNKLEGFIKKALKDSGITLEARRHHAGEQIKYCYGRLVEKGAKPIPLTPYHPFIAKDIIVSPEDGRSIERTEHPGPFGSYYRFYRWTWTKKIIRQALKEYSEIIRDFADRQSKLLDVLKK